MNLLMDSLQHSGNQPRRPPAPPPQHTELRICTTPPTALTTATSPTALGNNNNGSPVTGKTNAKRSFDVAFLMMPDDRIKQKQAEKQARLNEALLQHHHNHHHHHQQQQLQPQPQPPIAVQYPTDLSPRAAASVQSASPPIEYISLLEARQRYPQLSIRSPRIYDDPTVVIPLSDSPEASGSPLRSAFTKVASSLSTSSSSSSSAASATSSSRLESPVDVGAPPLSPDQLSCHSISPPIQTPPPRTSSGGSGTTSSAPATPVVIGPMPPSPIGYHNFRPEYQFNGAFQAVNPMQALQAQQRLKQQLLYRPPHGNLTSGPPTASAPTPEFLQSAYPGFPFPPGANAVSGGPLVGGPSSQPSPHQFVVGPPELPRIVQHPAAAAIFSTLIPPTLASTFTLTAQNVCAKCNISFRMTSDLVYHMRSHHKSEVACDPNRRKREEKLRCPVCQETFRERHHLTRHMTAHQDKASDHQPSTDDHQIGDGEIINVVSAPPANRRLPGGTK